MSEQSEPSLLSRPLVLWLMVASIGFYAGDGYGWLIGAGAAIAFVVCVGIGNVVILAQTASLSWTTRFRVILYIISMLMIAISRAETCSAGTCVSLFG
jgi:hypothetical protein